MTEKEMLVVVFAFDKIRSYLIGSKEICDLTGTENQVVDHLSKHEGDEKKVKVEEIVETFSHEQLLAASLEETRWYADITNYLTSGIVPYDLSSVPKKMFSVKYIFGMSHICLEYVRIIRRCIPGIEQSSILKASHTYPYSGHFGGVRTAIKVLELGNISRQHEIPMNPIQEIEVFDVWEKDFMEPFVSSYCNKYILVVVDYVSKWMEAVSLPTNATKGVMGFLRRNIFIRFGNPREKISENGTHLCNRAFTKLVENMAFTVRWAIRISPNKWTSGAIEQRDKECVNKNSKFYKNGLGKEVG
ncbi:uncharacterized protein [Nicotiana sylvestris]|uniref:uncharacterized protein n=1 Tax=Nicotiana sylvestris TaxID=4096 RepID=UPI00388CE80C